MSDEMIMLKNEVKSMLTPEKTIEVQFVYEDNIGNKLHSKSYMNDSSFDSSFDTMWTMMLDNMRVEKEIYEEINKTKLALCEVMISDEFEWEDRESWKMMN